MGISKALAEIKTALTSMEERLARLENMIAGGTVTQNKKDNLEKAEIKDVDIDIEAFVDL